MGILSSGPYTHSFGGAFSIGPSPSVETEPVIPDLTRPIVAARMWDFDEGAPPRERDSDIPGYKVRVGLRPARLISTGQPTVWESAELEASHSDYSSYSSGFAFPAPSYTIRTETLPDGTIKSYPVLDRPDPPSKEDSHQPPEPRCSCGIYAVSDLERLHQYGTHGRIFGVVHLWGRVIPGEVGWRAQYARIVRLIAWNRRDKKTRAAAKAYGVSVAYSWPELTQPEEVAKWTSDAKAR